MIIHFWEARFLQFVKALQQHPHRYLSFDSVADFYQCQWLKTLPPHTEYFCTGLDDGAEQFDILIQYLHHQVSIHIAQEIKVIYRELHL